MGLIGRGLPDSAVIEQSQTDGAAFEPIFERYYSRIYSYLASRVGPDTAEDLASEVFTVAFRQRSSYRSDATNAGPWLYGIAANLARRHYRSNARRQRAFGKAAESAVVMFDPDLDDRVDAQQRAAELTTVLNKLRDKDREVLLLYALADLSYEEISVALSIPVGTVRSRLSRTRARLRNLIPDEGQQGIQRPRNPEGGA